jgi:hypothetical protein
MRHILIDGKAITPHSNASWGHAVYEYAVFPRHIISFPERKAGLTAD